MRFPGWLDEGPNGIFKKKDAILSVYLFAKPVLDKT